MDGSNIPLSNKLSVLLVQVCTTYLANTEQKDVTMSGNADTGRTERDVNVNNGGKSLDLEAKPTITHSQHNTLIFISILVGRHVLTLFFYCT